MLFLSKANPKALIVGGDSGIGRAVAIAFARKGADVAINYLPVEQDDTNMTLLEIKSAEQKGIDILVNDAGRRVYVEKYRRCNQQTVRDYF